MNESLLFSCCMNYNFIKGIHQFSIVQDELTVRIPLRDGTIWNVVCVQWGLECITLICTNPCMCTIITVIKHQILERFSDLLSCLFIVYWYVLTTFASNIEPQYAIAIVITIVIVVLVIDQNFFFIIISLFSIIIFSIFNFLCLIIIISRCSYGNFGDIIRIELNNFPI